MLKELSVKEQVQSLQRNPKISVLLGTRNDAEFLPQCLEGIAGQTFRDVEFLIFNDASTDQTATILDTFDFRGLPHQVIHSRERRGAPGGINFLLTQARGEFVWPIASDDYCCDPTFLAEGISMLTRCPGAAGFFGVAEIYNQDLGKTEFAWGVGGPSRFITPRKFAKGFFANRNGPHGAAMVIRREWLTRTGSYDPSLGAHSDYLPNSAAGLREGFCYVARPVVVVRVFGNQRALSATQTPEENTRQLARVETKLRQQLEGTTNFSETTWSRWRDFKICTFFNVAHRVRAAKKNRLARARSLAQLTRELENALEIYRAELRHPLRGTSAQKLMNLPFQHGFLRVIQRLARSLLRSLTLTFFKSA
jgi:glycosyltransferase involved in cell wall biosynthesis